ncbi:MAG: hypothetical protein ACXVCV_21890 [Polyangia bacterium]
MIRWLALAALAGCAACTVDVGAVPDAGPCAGKPDFFVSDVWPRYLVPNQCVSRGCHDFDNGHGYLRLHTPEAAPAPGTALDGWPIGWRENYLSTIQLVRCDQPLTSRLLTVPEGQSNLHPPGPVVLDRALAATLIQTWVAP